MGKIRVFTAFSGYDSQCLALDRLKQKIPQFDYELVGWSEIDNFAIQAHNSLFPQWAERNYGDISKVDWNNVPDFDLFTYSSPCQDFSNAGLQRGGQEGSGTRSSLLWECRRAIIAKRPKFLLLENVAALVSQKFLPLFNKWQLELEGYGYTNYAQVLNAKDYGIPQNRERIFLISILNGDRYYFPNKLNLEKRLKDILEDEVNEKYYLSDKQIISFVDYSIRKQSEGCGFKFEPTKIEGCAKCITTREGRRCTDNFIEEYNRIRRLTPKECFRLMGVEDKDIDKIKNVGISDSQQYKLAGNSIVVDVLFHIFRKMFVDKENELKDMYLF